MSPFGRSKSPSGPEISHPPAQYVDIASAPLRDLAERGQFDKDTKEFREEIRTLAVTSENLQGLIEKKAIENTLLQESLHTTTNHYLFLDFFGKLRESLIPDDKAFFDFGHKPYDYDCPPVYGTEKAFRAQVEHLRILALDSDEGNQKCFPAWIIGKQLVEDPSRKQSLSTQYLAISLDHHLPEDIQNYTEYHKGYASYFHRLHTEGGFLKRSTDSTLNSADGIGQPHLSAAVSSAARAAHKEGFGLIQFTAPADLEPIKLTEENIRSLSVKEKDEYDIRPLALTYIADHDSVNFISDAQPACIDDLAMTKFGTLHHLTQIAGAYDLVDELEVSVIKSRTGKQQADERTERAWRRVMRSLA